MAERPTMELLGTTQLFIVRLSRWFWGDHVSRGSYPFYLLSGLFTGHFTRVRQFLTRQRRTTRRTISGAPGLAYANVWLEEHAAVSAMMALCDGAATVHQLSVRPRRLTSTLLARAALLDVQALPALLDALEESDQLAARQKIVPLYLDSLQGCDLAESTREFLEQITKPRPEATSVLEEPT